MSVQTLSCPDSVSVHVSKVISYYTALYGQSWLVGTAGFERLLNTSSNTRGGGDLVGYHYQ